MLTEKIAAVERTVYGWIESTVVFTVLS